MPAKAESHLARVKQSGRVDRGSGGRGAAVEGAGDALAEARGHNREDSSAFGGV